jgi:hypothetical protein
MTTDHIRYDLLAQDALRGVVRRVLTDAAREGLPGEHHFYISFKTQHPGVRISSRLAEKYPDEITIVLQHQFWDLSVTDAGFEVGLSFGNAPEKLVVPFDAISGFFDPSVQFGLKFEVLTAELEEAEADVTPAPAPVPAPSPRHSIRGAASEPVEAPAAKSRPKSGKGSEGAAKSLKVVAESNSDDAGQDKGEKIVSLDTFRKKK